MKTIVFASTFILLFQQVAFALMITLGWDANATEDAVTHYTLKWGFVSHGQNHDYDAGSATTYTISEPWSPGMTIYFVVTASNATGESLPSNEIAYTVPHGNPANPKNLRILGISK